MSKINNNNNSSSSSSSSSSPKKVNGRYTEQGMDVEVTPIAKRRQFSAEYKARIVAEADGCTKPGEIGALLRREGLYSSNLSTWRREQSQASELNSKKRGRKEASGAEKELARLKAENERLRAELERAETIIDVQKKISSLFGQAKGETKQEEGK